jgi:hypothetical protein
MSTQLVRDGDGKGFLLTRFWAGGPQYEITDARRQQVRLTAEQAQFLVDVLTVDLKVPKP